MARKNLVETEEVIQISKSEIKREMHELQELGEQLVQLNDRILDSIELEPILRDAVDNAKRFKGVAKNRQLQYIGKVMRKIDPEPVKLALDKINHRKKETNAEFHKLETLRDELIKGDNSLLEETLSIHPTLERQRMRQLIRQANKELKQKKSPRASREIFKYLREAYEI